MRILLAIMLLFVGGCRKSAEKTTTKTPGGTVEVEGDKVTVQTKDGKATMESDKGSTKIQTKDGTMTMSENKVPEGFPLPIMKGAKVEQGLHMTPADGQEFFQVGIKLAAPPKDIAEFYEKALKDKGLDVSRSETTTGDGVMIMLTGKSDAADGSVMVMKDSKAEKATATISWSPKKK
jgi:hypothetical protein